MNTSILAADTVPPSTTNVCLGVAMPHPIGTDLADAMFTTALRATEEMVRTAAMKSMPQGRFIPKFELEPWDSDAMAKCGALFADAVRAVNAEKRGRRAA